MKKYLLLSVIVILTALLAVGCGETKKETPDLESGQTDQTIIEEKVIESDAEAPEETAEAESEKIETTTGEAPVAEAPKKADYSKTPLKCSIVALDDAATGNYRKITKSGAKEMLDKGKILLVKGENGELYFVYNQDGSFGGKNLAKYAANDFIGILGKVKQQYGINIIIAETIESMD